MDVISSLTDTVKGAGSTQDDDWINRMSRLWSVGLFVLFAVVVTTGTYVGDPIDCWCPAYFTSGYVSYTDKICWVSNTYYVPIDDKIPDDDSMKPHLTYYQWTPFILLFQAALFYMPRLFWSAMSDKSGFSIADVVNSARDYQKASNFDEREKTVKFITRHLDRFLDLRGRRLQKPGLRGKAVNTCMCCTCQRNRGNYLLTLFIITKALYLANAIGQIFLLNKILSYSFHLYGIDVIGKVLRGEDWSESPQFPRVTLCDFKVRQLGNLHGYTVQCVLPINLFNEKIFIFVWFWLAFIALLAAASLVAWIWHAGYTRDREQYIKRHIRLMGTLTGDSDRRLVSQFTKNYLKEDGLFILQLVSRNASDIVVSEVMNALWENYKDFKPHRKKNEDEPETLLTA